MVQRPALLFTQCLQNDFVQLLGKHDPLPNLLHVGYQESRRLLGERVEEGPVHSVMEWAYGTPREKLAIIHIRDWHRGDDPAQQEHLERFGPHCLQSTHGADFVFASLIDNPDRHVIIDSPGLSDFTRTPLADFLKPYEGLPLRVGIIGVWTEAKVSFLAYDLKTRYPLFDVSVCSALTAGSSRGRHFLALDQLENILGVRVFPSMGAFTSYLTGSVPRIEHRLSARLDESHLEIEAEYELCAADRRILLYLFRDCRRAELKTLDGGFSGNVVLKARAEDMLGHLQVPVVIKIGERDAIAEERTAFERIQEVMGNSAPSIVDFVELENRGAIKYRYASMLEGRVTTFQDLYAKNDDLELLGSILDTVFRKQLGRLYRAASLEKMDLLAYYDFSARYAPGVRRRTEELIGKTAEGSRLTLPPGVEIANICDFYEKDLLTLKEQYFAYHHQAYLHGDLNGRNIIIDEQNNVWLIDFFHTHRGHVLRDLIKMENDILYIFTAIDGECEFREALELSSLLINTADLALPPDPEQAKEFRTPALRKAWRIITRLRSFYPQLIGSDRGPYQLQVALMRYAVHTLSFDESSLWQRRWALTTGAVCSECIGEYIRDSARLRIDFLSLPGPGRVGLTILPGRKDHGRDLEEDLTTLQARGITRIVCLITPAEFSEYGVTGLKEGYQRHGFQVRYFPILDQRAPIARETLELLAWVDRAFQAGESVLIHCVGGLGRSGLVAAAYLKIHHGFPADDAIARVREDRSARAIETREQESFVRNLRPVDRANP